MIRDPSGVPVLSIGTVSRRLSQEARRKAIEAAQALVTELGIDRFTVDGVARRSGVAKTTLYRHWKSGTELLIDAVGQCIEQVEIPDLGALRPELAQLVERLGAQLGQPLDRKLLLGLLAAAMTNPELQRLKEAALAQRTAPARLIVQRAIERGEIPPIDLDTAVHVIHGPFLARALSSMEPIGADEVDELVTIIARGLGASVPPVGAGRELAAPSRPDQARDTPG